MNKRMMWILAGGGLLYYLYTNATRQSRYMASFTGPSALSDANAWQEAGNTFLRADGSAYIVTAMPSDIGGFLYDNCPLNVALGLGWQAGQKELLSRLGYPPCNG